MPIPTLISQLSTTAAINSPQGTESAKGTIDDYLRAHAAFIAINRDAIDDITAQTGMFVTLAQFGDPALSATWATAIAAMPADGGTITLPVGIFPPFPGTLTHKNIVLRGAGKPVFNAASTGLEGGTIIQGPFVAEADGLQLHDLGIDSGLDVCTALYAGVAQEGFSFQNVGQVNGKPPKKGLVLKNVSAILKENTAPNHAVLVENVTGADISNIHTRFGIHGTVLKAIKSNARGIFGDSHGANSVIIKSDSFAECYALNVTGVVSSADIAASGGGVRVHGATAAMAEINLSDVVTRTGNFGVLVEANPSSVTGINISKVTSQGAGVSGLLVGTSGGGVISSASFDSIYAANSGSDGFNFSGTISHSSVSNCRAIQCGGDGFDINIATLGFNLANCKSVSNGGYGFNWNAPSNATFEACTDYGSTLGLRNVAWASVDYSEGSFTPRVIGSTVAGLGTYTDQVGSYIRIGNLVSVSFNVAWSAHTGTGNMLLTDLPFVASGLAVYSPVAINHNIAMGAGTLLTGRINPATLYVTLINFTIATGAQSLQSMVGSASLQVQLSYRI